MSAPRLKVVLTRRLPDAVETRMRELFDAELNLTDRPMDRAALEAAVQRAAGVIAVHDEIPRRHDETWASPRPGGGARAALAERVAAASARAARRVNISRG